jgi:tripartite ATP-independent transporter DctM subunit
MEVNPQVFAILMFSGLLVGLFMGHPLAFILGGLAVIFGWIGWGPQAFYMFANRIYGVMNSYILVAVPLFILMAQFLDLGGIAEKLFNSMRYVFGAIRGGIAITVVVVSTLFAACTGIIGASVVTMGLIALPLMLKYGYSKRLATGVVCGGGTLGILIPPSIMLIVMADLSELSVGRVFAGAIIPGLILGGLYISYIFIKCYLNPQLAPSLSAEERSAISTRDILLMTMKSIFPVSILVIGVLGSIFSGIATPTEAAGVGSFFAFLLMVVYGRFTWRILYKAALETAKITSMVLIVLCGATCFTGVFMGVGGDKVVSGMILGVGFGKWGTFIIMMVIFFVLGMFVDWIAITMICFPIFLPIANQLGFDKLWFVVIVAVMLQDSFLTPPFGAALFYLKGVAPKEVSTSDIYWGAFPFWRLMELGLIICCLFPQTITWLPKILVK